MPTYSYKCPNDDCAAEQNEVFHKLNEGGPTCPDCNILMVKKLCAPGFVFKGYGSQKVGSVGSIDAKEVSEGLMNAAREGAKKGGQEEGARYVQKYQRELAKKR